MGHDTKMDVVMTTALVLEGIPYLPHYSEANRYVSPGYGQSHFDTYSGMELIAMGAKPEAFGLWPRAWGKRGEK
jgi:hypothetical protein